MKEHSVVTNKAQAIRDMATQLGKQSRPKHIIAALAEKGITVVSAQVSAVLKAAGMRKARRRKKVVVAVAAQHASRNGKNQAFSIDDLIKVWEFAVKIGGFDQLMKTVTVIDKIRRVRTV